MTDKHLLSLTQESRLLTEKEKKYWEKSIVHMNPEQKTRLKNILTRGQNIPWNERIQNYLSLIGASTKKNIPKKA